MSDMTDKRDLLIELGTEELPPKALKKLIQAFEKGIKQGLEKGIGRCQFSWYCTTPDGCGR